jgi:3-oxoacyl-[acyl-carrier protein] reductase
MGDTDFTGKTILVVGGSSDIGNGIAHAFRARGRLSMSGAHAVVRANYDGIEASDLAGFGYQGVDGGDPDAIGAALGLDRLDVLVLCQGTVVYKRGEFEREG